MASFGETLKRQRELREISLRQISEATKINIRYLEALEQNHFEILPGGLFNKGFIRAYAAYVGLDAEGMVNSYLSEISARQQGSAPAAPEPSGLHRPPGPPPRRTAGPRDLPAPRPAITFAPQAAASPAAPPPDRAPASPATPVTAAAPATAPAPRPAHFEAQRPHAITRISDLPPEPRAGTSPRTLLWILTAIVGAGVVLLVLSLMSGPRPGPAELEPPPGGPPADPAAAPGTLSAGVAGTPPGTGGGAAPIPTGTAEAPAPGGAAEPAAPAAAGGGPERSDESASGTGGTAGAAAAPVQREAGPEPPPRVPRPATAPEGPMALEVTTVWSSWVEVSCDGRTVLDRQMRPGDSEAFVCRAVIRVSATDAGAVRLRVNDASCLALGDPGARAYGYTIRIDDFRRICRPASRDDDDDLS